MRDLPPPGRCPARVLSRGGASFPHYPRIGRGQSQSGRQEFAVRGGVMRFHFVARANLLSLTSKSAACMSRTLCLLVVQHWTDRISLGNRLQGKQKDRATYEASVRRFGRDVCHRKLRQCIHRNGRRVLPAGRLRSMAFTSVATWELTGKTLTGA